MMKYMIYILVILMLSVSASCVRDRADDCKLPSRLVSVDSLMQRDPQAALDTLVGGTLSGTDLGDYYTLLVSEALFKTYNEQQMRGGLMEAVHAFDSLHALYPDSDGYALLSARSHYMNGVGYYENDSLVPACQEYLTAIDIMERHFDEDQLVGYKAKLMALAYNRLVDLFSEYILPEAGIYFGRKSLKYNRIERTSKYGEANILYGIGNNHDICEREDSAFFYYNKALEALPDKDNGVYRKTVASRALLSYIMNGDSQESIKQINEAFKDANDEKPMSFAILGYIYYNEKEYDSALIYLNSAFETNIISHDTKIRCAKYLIEIYNELGNTLELNRYSNYISVNMNSNGERQLLVSNLGDLFHGFVRSHDVGSRNSVIYFVGLSIILFAMMLGASLYERRIKRMLGEQMKLEKQMKIEERVDGAANSPLSEEEMLRGFYNEPICREILGMVCYIPINTRTNYSDYPNVKLNNDMIVELGKAVDKHFPCLKYALNSTGVSLKNSDMLLLHLYLVGLNPIQIALLRQCHYSTVSRQVSQLKEKLSVEGDLGSFIKNHAIS